MDRTTTYLWLFPPQDFQVWQTFAEPGMECLDYEDYLAALASSQLAFEADGHRVVRVRLAAEEMKARLAKLGIANTPGWRNAVLKVVAAERGEGRS